MRPNSPAVIVSLFLWALSLAALADDMQRVRSENFPLSLSAPSDWISFPPSPKGDPNEILFLQTPDESAFQAILSVGVHPLTGKWEDLVKRQTYLYLVWEGATLTANDALKLRGAQGHKWIYQARAEDGESKLYYRLCLLLPASLGAKRLLVLQGVAPAAQSPQMVPLFNDIARSLAWGLQP